MLLTLVAFAVSLLGFAAVPAAHAAAEVTVTGTGAESSESVSLPVGIYRVQLSYTDNIADSGPTNFVARLSDSAGQADQPLANDIAADNTQRRILELSKPAELWVDVSVAAIEAKWQVSFEKLTEPSAGVSMLSVTGTGSNAADLYRLNAGTYAATVTYSGNQSGDTGNFKLSLVGKGSTKQLLIDGAAAAGTATINVRIASAGTYWLKPLGSDAAQWSVKLAPALKLTTTPTPTISGTVKVGRTLTAKPGTWKPSGVSFTYQWKRNGSAISGATKSTYKLTSTSKGKKITVTVTGSKVGYVPVAKTSKSTVAVKK